MARRFHAYWAAIAREERSQRVSLAASPAAPAHRTRSFAGAAAPAGLQAQSATLLQGASKSVLASARRRTAACVFC